MTERQAKDREARTFKHPGIDVMTKRGLVTLTREMAHELKEEVNAGHHHAQRPDYTEHHQYAKVEEKKVCRPFSSPRAEVSELDQWEASKVKPARFRVQAHESD